MICGLAGANAGPPSLLLEIRTGPAGSYPGYLTRLASGLVLFAADDGVNGSELWRTDGTPEGTYLLKDIRSGPEGSEIHAWWPPIVDGKFVFTANDGVHGGEMWRSDGTAAGTQLVADIYPGTFGAVEPRARTTSGRPEGTAPDPTTGGFLIFSANDGVHGTELWRTDLTPAGTAMVKDINTLTDHSSSPSWFTNVNGIVYFQATNGPAGYELWRTDSTEAGTWQVKDINTTQGSGGSGPHDLVNLGGTLLFSATDRNVASGGQLWRSDGTEAGTLKLADDFGGNGPSEFVLAGNQVFMTGIHGSEGWELWRSDGTVDGTHIVKDINPGPGDSRPERLTKVGSAVYFEAYEPDHGYELWRSDGTEAGTNLMRDITPGPQGTFYFSLTEIQNRLVFLAEDPIHGREPWESTGPGTDTRLIDDIRQGTSGSEPSSFTLLGSTILFAADDGTKGMELWKMPSTGAPTAVVLRTLTATRSGTSVVLRWTIAARRDVLGFRVYRQDGAGRVRLDRGLIRRSAATRYAFRVRSERPARYWVEAVLVDGRSAWRSVRSA